jgi:RNA polymerase sigma-70 factor (family 1)
VANYSLYTDQELVSRLKRGDPAAYTEIYGRYERLLFIHAYKRLQNREEARDIVQDLFIVLWARQGQLDLTSSLRAYLYTAIRNRIFDLIARQKLESDYVLSLQRFIDAGDYSTDHRLRINQLNAIIEKEVAQLPPKMREVFELSRNEHLSHREIAQRLDIAEQTVKKQVQNALKVLKVKLGPLLTLLLM